MTSVPGSSAEKDSRGDVGIDIGKRRIAIGWPWYGMSAALDMKKIGPRAGELLVLKRWLISQLPVGVQLWIELPYVSNGPAKNPTTTIGMAETVGMILTAQDWENEPIMVGQSTWKAQVCGNGNSSKEDVARWLFANNETLYGKTDGEEDRIDAMCIGMYGKLRSDGLIQAPVKQPRKKPARRSTWTTPNPKTL